MIPTELGVETSQGMSLLAAATVAHLSPRPPARVDVEAPLWKVVDEMKAANRGCVLVVEATGALVGIFTERDLLSRVDHTDPLWSHVVVRDIMTAHPMTIHPEASLAEAMRKLLEGHRRHLPIVDEHGTISGVLSIRDILTFIAQKFPEDMMNLPPDPSHEL